jgi:hypothetical protein
MLLLNGNATSGPPTSTDTADFNTGGGTISGGGSAGAVFFSSGSWTLAGVVTVEVVITNR